MKPHMPKRIKELAEVAKLQPYYDAQAIAIQTFAYLLIEECEKVCKAQRDPSNLNYKPSESFAEAIKMHFR